MQDTHRKTATRRLSIKRLDFEKAKAIKAATGVLYHVGNNPMLSRDHERWRLQRDASARNNDESV
jgi:hypothetical protein